MNNDLIYFNGINCQAGNYYTQPLSTEELSNMILGRQEEPDNIRELQHKSNQGAHYGLPNRLAVDSDKLDKVGWAVIFHKDADEHIKRALKPLLDLRKQQAGSLFKECIYATGDSKAKFFRRYEVSRGPTQPEKLPYYLLIVGSPTEIPFSFQYQLDVEYAVGRIYFEDVQEYANYAAAVVAAQDARLNRDMTFFSVETPNDGATADSHRLLVGELGRQLQADDFVEAKFKTIDGDQAIKENLTQLLGGDQTPALLLTTGHGAGFPAGHDLQRKHQGALITREWPGLDNWNDQVVDPKYYFSGENLLPDGNLVGTVAFLFACFGGGTPVYDDFWRWEFRDSSMVIAPDPFLAHLPQQILARPGGGALAIVAHVDRVWSFSFKAAEHPTPNLVVFKEALGDIFRGVPLGHAMKYFNDKYAELASDLTHIIDSAKKNPLYEADPYEVVSLWTAHNDARSYIIIGDPAAIMPVADVGQPATERPKANITIIERSGIEETAGGTMEEDSQMTGEEHMRDGVHGYTIPPMNKASLKLKKEDPELYAIWRDQIKSGYEQNTIMFKEVLNAFMKPYHETVRMYRIMFIVGISLFVIAALLSVWSQDPIFGLVFGGLGVATFLTFFISKPLNSLEENLEFITWLGVIYNNYWTRLTNVMNEETALEDIRAAGKDANDEFERLINKHAEMRGKRPGFPKTGDAASKD